VINCHRLRGVQRAVGDQGKDGTTSGNTYEKEKGLRSSMENREKWVKIEAGGEWEKGPSGREVFGEECRESKPLRRTIGLIMGDCRRHWGWQKGSRRDYHSRGRRTLGRTNVKGVPCGNQKNGQTIHRARKRVGEKGRSQTGKSGRVILRRKQKILKREGGS